jgi:gluconate 2-dehydrogenase gamma chain
MTDSKASHDPSRRSFLLSSGSLVTTAWIAANWAGIAQAAHHADESLSAPAPVGFQFFSPAEAADVEAIGAQIVPSGKTPGAREAHAVYFIDRTFATYFGPMGVEYRKGLGDFQGKFHAGHAGVSSFAAADAAAQIEFLKGGDTTPFFETTRMLTILGMFTSPKYGGNFQGIGWKVMGFADQHAFQPPFGYYDAEYQGFVPYTEKRA